LRELRTERRFKQVLARSAPSARAGPHPFVVVLDHLRPVRNAAAIVRSADAFGGRAVYLIGTRFFDPVPAMGSLKNVPLQFFARFEAALESLLDEGYTVYALEPARDVTEPNYLQRTALAEKAAFVVGNEGSGLSFWLRDQPRVVPLTIGQYGGVPSLNVSVSAALAMFEWVRQHGKAPNR
jgi:tRNA G18 (ribose-2'-O)-methylase SpoU